MNSPESNNVVVAISPARVAGGLLIFMAGLFIAHLMTLYLTYAHDMDYAKGFIPLFYINQERSAPAFFSSALFLLGAAGFYLMHRTEWRLGNGGKHWLLMFFVALFLAFDEAAGIHELLIYPVRELLGTTGIFYYAWVIPYGIAVGMLGLYVIGPVLRLPPNIRLLFVLSAVVYVTGVIGLEMVGGAYIDSNSGVKNLMFEAITTVEELMEMAGLILLVYAQCSLMRCRGVDIVLSTR